MNNQICCSMRVISDAGVDSGPDAGGGIDGGDAGTMDASVMDSGITPPTCGTMCAYNCTSMAVCMSQQGTVCN